MSGPPSMPPIIRATEVHKFEDELAAVLGGGYVVAMRWPSPDGQSHLDVAVIEERLHALMRLALQASYQAGSRVVKIASLGALSDHGTDSTAVLGTANVLNALVRTDFASLEALDVWGTTGPPYTDSYQATVDLVALALRMYRAIGMVNSEVLQRLDLWFETTVSPFSFDALRLTPSPELVFLGGHLADLRPPAFDWLKEEPQLLTRSSSPIAIDLLDHSGCEFAGRLLEWLPTGKRNVIVKALPDWTPQLQSVAERLRTTDLDIVWLVVVDTDDPQLEGLTRLAEGLHAQGYRLSGIDCRVPADKESLTPVIDAASATLAVLCDEGQ